MPQIIRGRNLLIRGGLQAYALTLPLLGFICTWYVIKSRDMNEKGKVSFSITNHICLQMAFMVHCTWCVHSVPAPCSHPSARSACTHTQWHSLLLLGQRGGGVHVLKYTLLIPFE